MQGRWRCMIRLYVCTRRAVAESDELQDSGDEMQKNALAGVPGQAPESGKMCFFDQGALHMASSLLALLDDIATILDDVAVMSKVAAKKTAGVLGDDLALNAQQVSGVNPERELPVVWAVAKGSFVNKAILVPSALAISVFAPWAITPLLMLGGAYLCFEGAEKLAHKFLHSKEEDARHRAELTHALSDPAIDMVALEKDKIKGAVRTDFILSAEIIVISLGTVAEAPLLSKVGVLVAIAIIMTIGVYGLVAGIVKLDDLGLHLQQKSSAALKSIGNVLLIAAPKLMKTLAVVGTAAMFMVGGGILVHGLPALHHMQEAVSAWAAAVPGGGAVASTLFDAIVGLAAGALVVVAVTGASRLFKRKAA
jgi:predicted DNA repair protein MutK